MTQAALHSFTAREQGSARAVARLVEVGFELGQSRGLGRSLLDTFDGRLHRAGLRLELRQGEDLELILSGEGIVPAHMAVLAAPRFPSDLPPGPFRSRLAAAVDVRALLPVIRVTATATPATRLDRAGKTIAMATVFDDLVVDGHDGVDVASWTIEVVELAGYGAPARKVLDVLDQLGLERLDGDTLSMAAMAAGVDLAGYSGSPTIPLDPEMPAIDGFRAVLTNLADTITANWRGTIDELDPEFLHDLRVAVRRTRCVVAQGKKVLPPSTVESARERFAWLGTLTSPARDLDVYIIEWDGYTSQMSAPVIAALEPVRALLDGRRRSAHAVLAEALQSAPAAELMASWRGWLDEPTLDGPPGVQAERPLATVVNKRIARAQTRLITGGRLIRADTPADQVHELRKDAKKLRYLLECFGSLLPAAPRKTFVRRLKAFQDNLGEHQDADVHVGELRAISRELHDGGASMETMLAMGQLIERLDQRRIAARTAFAERFAAYDTRATQRALDAALDGVMR